MRVSRSQFQTYGYDGLTLPQGLIRISKSKQLKTKFKLFVQDFIMKKFREEKLKIQDDALRNLIQSDNELEVTNFVCGLKILIHDDKPL